MMIKRNLLPVLLGGCLALGACSQQGKEAKTTGQANEIKTTEYPKGSFGYDRQFLEKYQPVVVLQDSASSGRVLVSPQYQGRVLTSSVNGDAGTSMGWINYDLIASGQLEPHMNAFGGEDRLWLGPEGGQFSIFFKKGDPFDLEHWQTPAAFDSDPYTVKARTNTSVRFSENMHLVNYSGTPFDIRVDREVRLLAAADVQRILGLQPAGQVNFVAYQSRNTLTNTGQKKWDKSSGLLSLWLLGMFQPAPAATIVIPYRSATKNIPVVNDTYFGKVPADRLVVQDRVIYFKADGKYRSKIGLTPERATNRAGSYDPDKKILTLIHYNKPTTPEVYVNSMWEIQKQPFAGDVINSYNDGPAKPGAKPMGPFYELETSSPAKALAPNESLTHVHSTFHFQGEEATLNKIVKELLGVELWEIKSAFGK